jgi:glutamate-1-semialdehyde 2,1-aminomutase
MANHLLRKRIRTKMAKIDTNSKRIFAEAVKLMPGGVNSPVRSFKSIGISPPIFESAKGAEMTDVDGNRYIDFCASWGVFMAGHAHPEVEKSVLERVRRGTSFGAPTEEETLLASKVVEMVPSIEMVRFVSSGTEAVMSAIRVARAFTNRSYILKFDGCYHGHADYLLASAGSGVAETESGSSPGVPADFTRYTLSVPFNRPDIVEETFKLYGNQIAAIIIEPLPANMGVVKPHAGFLSFLREITTQYGTLLIFDEVISGFRLARGGAQELHGITPDMTTLGKIIGGGFPAGAFGGSKEVMSLLAPVGNVYQAGTLSGNPVAMTAGLETLKLLSKEDFYRDIHLKASDFYAQLSAIIDPYPLSLSSEGSMFTLFFRPESPTCFTEVHECDMQKFAQFYRSLLHNGIYLSPSQYEANFITAAHTGKQLTHTLENIKSALKEVFD